MKKYFPFALLAVFAVLISCTEKEEPVSPLVGKWENRVFVDSLDFWVVETFEIKNDSVFEHSITVRQSENGANLGYRSFSEGKYLQAGNDVSLNFLAEYMYRQRENSEVYYVPKNELGPVIVERIFSSVKITLNSNLDELNYQINCFPPFDKSPVCEEIRLFIKVE